MPADHRGRAVHGGKVTDDEQYSRFVAARQAAREQRPYPSATLVPRAVPKMNPRPPALDQDTPVGLPTDALFDNPEALDWDD